MPHPIDTQKELLQVYDQDGNPVAPLTRAEVHAKPLKHWHGVVNVWIVNRQGDIIVSKRSPSVSGNPGKWQSYFGGHVPAGLSHLETAEKELMEEIGLRIDVSRLHLIDKGKVASPDHLHFHESYAYLFEEPLSNLAFRDGEVVEAKWLSLDDYWRERNQHPEQWCNGCNPENQARIRGWLAHLPR